MVLLPRNVSKGGRVGIVKSGLRLVVNMNPNTIGRGLLQYIVSVERGWRRVKSRET